MTFLDWTGQLETRPVSSGEIAVRLPLSVSAGRWKPEFTALAQSKNVQAQVDETPQGNFLTVMVPVAASREETAQLLDGALRLIDEAQAQADTRHSAVAATEQYVQDWWESRKRSDQGNAAPD
jgi:hypothetical protein